MHLSYFLAFVAISSSAAGGPVPESIASRYAPPEKCKKWVGLNCYEDGCYGTNITFECSSVS